MYNHLSKVLIVISVFLLSAPFKAEAIYQIYTCYKSYTRISGGSWVEQTNCEVTGYGEGIGGLWSIPQDREPPRYENGGTTYYDENGNEMNQQDAVESCKDSSFQQMQSCKRYANVGAATMGLGCFKFGVTPATAICEAVMIVGLAEVHMMCDRDQRTRDKACNDMN